jgi:ribosomal protein S18 acetylase RimI-like enzyme
MMLKGITRGRPDPDADNGVRTLTPADIDQLAIRNHPRLEEGDAEALVIQAPGWSKWHPASGEFLIVTPWRHRMEIPAVNVMSAFHHEDALLAASIASAEKQGAAAFVLLETYETRQPSFYARNGMQRLETIVTYELTQPGAFLKQMTRRRQQFVKLDRQTAELGEAVLNLDHVAFPWLWWNSAEEFSNYLSIPNIEVWAGTLDGNVISYVGFTHFWCWSHLDRIAIRPDAQRQGFGREALHFAVERMLEQGATRVGLSTQGENEASRNLYESIGFRETPGHNYDVHGVVFEPGRRFIEQGGRG